MSPVISHCLGDDEGGIAEGGCTAVVVVPSSALHVHETLNGPLLSHQ